MASATPSALVLCDAPAPNRSDIEPDWSIRNSKHTGLVRLISPLPYGPEPITLSRRRDIYDHGLEKLSRKHGAKSGCPILVTMATHKQYRNSALIEAMLRQMAPQYTFLRLIISVQGGEHLDLAFIVTEPLYDAETEIIPLFQRVLELTRSTDLDFVVIPERVSAEFESQAGARSVYEHRPGPPR